MKRILCLLIIMMSVGCTATPSTVPNVPGVNSQQPSALRPPLRVAVQAYFCSSMIGLIKQMEWDAQAGLPLELVVYQDGVYLNEGLHNDEWDVAVTGGAFIHALANYDALLIGHQIDGTGCNSIYVRKGSSILQDKGFNPTCPDVYGSARSVKGLNILHNDGTTSSYLLASWLESIGVARSSVNTLDSEFADIFSRFYAGEGDGAAITTSAGVYSAQEYGWVEAASFETLGISILESILCTKQAYDTRYDDITLFMRLVYGANDTLLADKQLQYDVVEKWYADTGNITSRNAVKYEVDNKSFIGTEQAKQLDMLDFAMNYAESYVKMGVLLPEDLTEIRENIVVDMLQDVLGA